MVTCSLENWCLKTCKKNTSCYAKGRDAELLKWSTLTYPYLSSPYFLIFSSHYFVEKNMCHYLELLHVRVWVQHHYNGIIMMMQILWRKCRFSHEDESSEGFPKKIISLAVAVRLVWSHDPKSYTSRSFSFWQVLPSQADQRVGSRQIDDRIADSRVRVVLTGRYNLVCSGWKLLLFWGEHCNCW